MSKMTRKLKKKRDQYTKEFFELKAEEVKIHSNKMDFLDRLKLDLDYLEKDGDKLSDEMKQNIVQDIKLDLNVVKLEVLETMKRNVDLYSKYIEGLKLDLKDEMQLVFDVIKKDK